jgi:membrane associated rhomboid family serine protease
MFGRITPVVRNLLIINVAVFFIDSLLSVDLNALLGLRYVLADTFYPYQFVTYMFLHGSTLHLFSNMFALFIFGPLLEQFWGPKRFLIFYMVTGIGSGLLFSLTDYFEKRALQKDKEAYVENPNASDFSDFIAEHGTIGRIDGRIVNMVEAASRVEDGLYEFPNDTQLIKTSMEIVRGVYNLMSNIPMVGASGAIFGILMAFGMLFPNTTLMLLFPPIPIKAKYFVAIYGFFELYAGIQRNPGDNVAHFAHLGGMLVAFILLKIWKKQRNKFY